MPLLPVFFILEKIERSKHIVNSQKLDIALKPIRGAEQDLLKLAVVEGSTSAKGVVEFATDAEFTTGTSETLVVNPKQVKDAIDTATDGMVTVDGVQTLTNKTVDADDNTISNLETDNFKSGVITTVVADASSALDTKLPSEKAVAEVNVAELNGTETEKFNELKAKFDAAKEAFKK